MRTAAVVMTGLIAGAGAFRVVQYWQAGYGTTAVLLALGTVGLVAAGHWLQAGLKREATRG